MQLHSVWKTQKITSEMVCLEENKCDMPKQMSMIVQMTDNLRANRAVTSSLKDYNCSTQVYHLRDQQSMCSHTLQTYASARIKESIM